MSVGNTGPRGCPDNLTQVSSESAPSVERSGDSHEPPANVTSRHGCKVFTPSPSVSARFWGSIAINFDNRRPGA